MSIIGDKIHRIRDFRGMTQKQLGMAVGFDEKSADVRIAQYESGTRTPKQALVESLRLRPQGKGVPTIAGITDTK